MTWILILTIYAGAWADTDSVSLTNVPGFKTVEACKQAGADAVVLVNGSKKVARWVCVKQ